MSLKYGLEAQTMDKIKAIFAHFSAIEEVLLYGSRAKGNYRKGSDIDIVLKGKELNYQTLSELASQLDDLLLPYSFDISLFHQITNPDLIDHINRVGKILYINKGERV